ncbi:MAG: flavodoxin-dependent (E)-4-hydroxy-3-methylbut-2-enyl-diphosphate synthase [Kosmotoga sp.]|nr:MAG: flavodoxin-dependent (E)-4-hydroxy-3-methylbut-2-enyl-diphosphate synthase [Kosmotoga sp.]
MIGGDHPVTIQSMTNTRTCDIEKTTSQIKELESSGCEIVRVAVPDEESADAIKSLVSLTDIPLVADIHYDYKLAIKSIKSGAHKVRINPGNIGTEWKVKEVVKVAKDYHIPIRVGANSGSIKSDFKHYSPEKALAESALSEVRLLEKMTFKDIVISAKSSDVYETVKANEYIHSKVDYPLHVGVTESGIGIDGTVKSALGIGILLSKGIGDTIRVSLPGNPVKEVIVAKSILKSLGMKKGVTIIVCPTCGRTEIDVEMIARRVEKATRNINGNIKIAVMGCVVNGIGEGSNSDIGIAGTKEGAVIFINGEIIETVKKEKIEEKFMKHLNRIIKNRRDSV